MTLSDTARAHVEQCHREDVSEELLLKLAAENDALRAELVDLRHESDMHREMRDELEKSAEDAKGVVARIHAAAKAELSRQIGMMDSGFELDAVAAIDVIKAINKAAQEAM